MPVFELLRPFWRVHELTGEKGGLYSSEKAAETAVSVLECVVVSGPCTAEPFKPCGAVDRESALRYIIIRPKAADSNGNWSLVDTLRPSVESQILTKA